MRISKNTIKWIAQLIGTIVFLAMATKRFDFISILGIFKAMSVAPLLLIPIFLFIDLLINSYRIKSILKHYGVESDIFAILKIKFFGLFFSLIFPLLGDAYKIQSIKQLYKTSWSITTRVILLDRIIYTLSITIILIPLLLLRAINVSTILLFAVCILLFVEISAIILLNNYRILAWFKYILHKLHLNITITSESIKPNSGYYKVIGLNTLGSILRNANMAVVCLLVAYSVLHRLDFNMIQFLAAILVIMLSGIIPISIGGIGLREYVAIIVFPQFGISPLQSISIALAISTFVMAQGLLAGIVLLISQFTRKTGLLTESESPSVIA